MAVRRKLTAIRLDKIAVVDRPCQEHATVAIVKRAPTGPVPPAIAKKTFQEALHGQLVSEQISDTFWRAFEHQWSVRDAFRTALTDEIADGGTGTVAVADFTAAMQQIASMAAEAARVATGTADTDLEAAVSTAISKWLTQQEQTTMNITTKAQLLSAVAKFDPATSPASHVTIIQKAATDLGETDALPKEGILAIVTPAAPDDARVEALQAEVAVLKMAPAIRKHYDGLDAAGQKAFLAKSAADQQATIDAIEKGDPIVYTCGDGTEIRKSDGTAALMMAKRLDAQDKVIAGMQGDTIEKRAAAYPNVAKATAVTILKSAVQVGEDTDAGKDLIKSLDAMNKGSAGIFKSLGSTSGDGGDSTGPSGDITKARGDFEGKVAEIRKRDNSSLSDAMSKARNEAPELYAAAYPAPADSEA
jgi:hypothetical protein